MNIKQIARKLRSADGAEIAEAALVLPLVFTLLLGIIWFGRAFNIYSTIQQAAQQGAITAARATCGTCGNTLAKPKVVYEVVEAVMNASSIDPSQIESVSPPTPYSCRDITKTVACKVHKNVTICEQALLNYSSGSASQTPQCGIIVSFQYPFTVYLPFTSLNMSKVTLSAQAQSRMEN
jgi:Flp pilus assembly protein TadG